MSDKSAATRQRILKSARKSIIERGYAGTSLDGILSATKLTKGAFFHHFKSKSELARALIEQYQQEDARFFEDLSRQADETTSDPLDNTLVFLELFENFLNNRNKPLRSCLYASYTHEFRQFDKAVIEIVKSGMARWKSIYRKKFDRLIRVYEPSLPATSDGLADMIVSLIEGGLIQARIEGNRQLVARQSAQFRQYLTLLFPRSSARA